MWSRLRNLIAPRPAALPGVGGKWVLVPLGNPGDAYAASRHNLGRLLLQRWAAAREPAPRRLRALGTGSVYELGDGLLALVPSTYMNHSGQACTEGVAAGLDPGRMIVLHDDKDLPLGLGRFRLSGGDAGHNGLASVIEHLGTQDVARLKLGIGPFQRPLHEFVLGEWTEEEWARIEGLDAAFARFLELLAGTGTLGGLPGAVNAAAFWTPPSREKP
ncbi:MAG TPA: aminoacyl-tRNA hydrolase [Holophaga sp.]|nr:aminoacyl-tRNA hydrolase [Holophaga sp.]